MNLVSGGLWVRIPHEALGDKMAIHIIAELYGVAKEKISRIENVQKILNRAISKSGLHVVSSNFYQFEPFGVSVVYLLRESHLSIHTWPEHEYVCLDIFTCGEDACALKTFEILLEEFKPKKVKKKILRRLVYGKGRK